MGETSSIMSAKVTNPKAKLVKHRIKVARLNAGYDKPIDLVDAINAYLERKGVQYRVNLRSYYMIEANTAYKVDVTLAYVISNFLGIPIDTFIYEKMFEGQNSFAIGE